MKTSAFPSPRVAPAAEQVLPDGVFVARGLASREHARKTGAYVTADAVLGRLEKMVASAKGGK